MSSQNNPHYLKPPFTPHQTYARRAAIEAILSALARCGGNVTRAATALGLQRTHLHRLITTLGIQRVSPLPPVSERTSRYRTQLMEGVKQAVIDALAASGGNRAEAARRLGIGRIYLRELIIRFKIAPRLPPGRPSRR